MHVKYLMFLYIIVSALRTNTFVDAEDEEDEDSMDKSKLWQPPGGVTADEWIRCRGMPCDQWKRRQLKLAKLNQDNTIDQNVEDMKDTNYNHPERMSDIEVENANEDEDGCTWLTEKQIDNFLEQNRTKRKIHSSAFFRWNLPVPYLFDGTHNGHHQAIVRKAVAHFEQNTCVRFQENGEGTNNFGKRIMITKRTRGCYSYIGRSLRNQPLNLERNCFYGSNPGIQIHELGHALGFFHEQQRRDRDQYVTIFTDNVRNQVRRNFAKYSATQTDVAYDFSSIMHYTQNAFSYNGKPVIVPKKMYGNYYSTSMGQRNELSFLDTKLINKAYCRDKCKNIALKQSCERSGYQDPNECTKCKCPPGFYGNFCELTNDPLNCAKSYNLQTAVTIASPGYPNNYVNNQKCSWYIKVPKNHKVKVTFIGAFKLFKIQTTCFHFVEVIFKKNLDFSGYRFCGYAPPSASFFSEGNEMMIIFNTKFVPGHYIKRVGFQAKLEVFPKLSRTTTQELITTISKPTTQNTTTKPTTTTPTTTPKPTTTLTTTTPTTTTPTTTTPTSTTPKPKTTPKPTTTPTTTTPKTTPKPTTTLTTTTPTTTTPKQKTATPKTTTTPTTTSPKLTTSKPTTTSPKPTSSIQKATTQTQSITPPKPTTSTATNPTTSKSIGKTVFFCSFEKGNHAPESCGITQIKSDENGWFSCNIGTPTSFTGPQKAHSGKYFVYMEATGMKPGNKVKLKLPSMKGSGKYCIKFWYFMYGMQVKQLAVFIGKKLIWKRMGNNGPQWTEANLKLNLRKNDIIVIEAIRGNSFLSDIALDEIRIMSC